MFACFLNIFPKLFKVKVRILNLLWFGFLIIKFRLELFIEFIQLINYFINFTKLFNRSKNVLLILFNRRLKIHKRWLSSNSLTTSFCQCVVLVLNDDKLSFLFISPHWSIRVKWVWKEWLLLLLLLYLRHEGFLMLGQSNVDVVQWGDVFIRVWFSGEIINERIIRKNFLRCSSLEIEGLGKFFNRITSFINFILLLFWNSMSSRFWILIW